MKDNKFISGIKHFLFMVFGRLLPDALWADKLYLKIFYKHKQGETLSFCNPVTFNAKTQWLKLYDRKNDPGRGTAEDRYFLYGEL